MCAQAFDTLTYFEQLKDAGVDEGPARVMAAGMRAQTETMQTAFDAFEAKRQKEQVTRQDLKEARISLEQEIFETRQELTEKITAFHEELKEDIATVRIELKEELHPVQLETNKKITSAKIKLPDEFDCMQFLLKKEFSDLKDFMRRMEIHLVLCQLGIGAVIVGFLVKALGSPGF